MIILVISVKHYYILLHVRVPWCSWPLDCMRTSGCSVGAFFYCCVPERGPPSRELPVTNGRHKVAFRGV